MSSPDSDPRSEIMEEDVPPEEEGEENPIAQPFRLADLEHPWLGLESFREETRAYFFGRDAEIAEIHLRLRSHPLLVLYGRSGLGKTSILRAGLLPRLTLEGHLPTLHRIDYANERYGPAGQLLLLLFSSRQDSDEWRLAYAMERWLDWALELQKELALDLQEDFPSWLWLRLHWRKAPPAVTHLVLDQFEEVFTLGVERPGAEHELRDSLAILLQRAIPEPISRLIAEDDVFLDHFDPDSTPLRVILALRDDYVYALNRWKRHLPALGQNNFELRALRGPAALDAVFKPGELRCHYRETVGEQNKVETGLPPIVSKEAAERIIHFVARKDEHIRLEEIEAVPPILSLLCRELNERRFTEPAGAPEKPALQISFSKDDEDVETIIKTFYERCLTDRPEGVRIFIEEELVSYSGTRLAQDEKSILTCFEYGTKIPGAPDDRLAEGYGDPAKARQCLRDLVDQRLLSVIGGSGNPSYELVHDLLAAVADKSGTAREERYEKEQARLRAEADRKAREDAEAQAQKQRKRAVVAFAFALVALVACVYAIYARSETERQKGEAIAAKRAAEELIYFMQYDLSDILGQVGRLDMMGAVNARIRKYHEDHPPEADNFDALRERAVSFIQHGDVQSAQGDIAGALKSYRDSLVITEKLSKQDPGNVDWQRDLSVSYEKIGDVQSDQDDLAGALKSHGDSLVIREKLSKQDPGNTEWERNLSVSYEKVGDVQRAQGNLAGALKSYDDTLVIREKLSKQDPGNTGWQRDLSVSYEKFGDVQSDQDDFAGALKSYGDSLAIREKLLKQDPGNPGWQSDLSISYIKVGEIQGAMGDLAGALKSYRYSLVIREKLSAQDPGNAGWQGELAFCYWRTGTALVRSDPTSKKEAQTMVERGRDILKELKTRTGLTALQQQWLESIEANLLEMEKEK